MLSKETFINSINAIVKHREIMDELKVPLQKLGDFPLSLDMDSLHRDALLKVLQEATGDKSDWIGWWLYEDVDKIVEWEEDGETFQADLTEVGALYDFLLSNVENAGAATLPLTDLNKDYDGNTRQAIDKNDFLLFFDACLHHVNTTGTTLYICEGAEPKYVLITMDQYKNLYGDLNDDYGKVDCPNCGHELRVMCASENKEHGGHDVLAHCENCHMDYEWRTDANGCVGRVARHFFG